MADFSHPNISLMERKQLCFSGPHAQNLSDSYALSQLEWEQIRIPQHIKHEERHFNTETTENFLG